MIKIKITIIAIFVSSLAACAQQPENKTNKNTFDNSNEQTTIINPTGKTIESRFKPPLGFQRSYCADTSFGTFLRKLPLKIEGSLVKLYNGRYKTNQNIYVAVVDLEIGNKNLHQCADAIIRLRAEYLWHKKKYDEIHFNLTNGFRVDYWQWKKGKRVEVKGNKTYWIQKKNASNTYEDLWNYLEFVFTYAGTLSLSKELTPTSVKEMKIGDVFIAGGSPGHAILIVDMATNKNTGETLFIIAQSYMPAQEIQILKNNNNSEQSPWYSDSQIADYLETPEWIFKRSDLKKF